jgi:hypothetical protein
MDVIGTGIGSGADAMGIAQSRNGIDSALKISGNWSKIKEIMAFK